MVNDDTTAVLISQVSDLRDDIKDLRDDVKGVINEKVSYREWAQRNGEVNHRLGSLGREIGDLRTEIRAKSAPWWSVSAILVAVASLAWTVLGPT